MRITIAQSTLAPGERPLDHWATARSILELVEPGAGHHAVRFSQDLLLGTNWDRSEVYHHRLDLTIEVTTPREVPA
jgi:hypothetical protein